tara:strand:+ start:186 stop:452 length:267 start_codon:yes stop_codon:yes gene_type:complete
MANTININTKKLSDKYIKTFDCCDDPLVFSITRISPYTFEAMIVGIFDSREAALLRLNRMMETPLRADEKFIVEVHQLRTVKQEEDLD